MNRSQTALSVLSQAIVAALFVCGAAACFAAPASPRPNVIVILADDQGYADLGVQGQVKDVRTPNIDALAASGVRFTSGYVTSPQCSPSRAGLITGRYQNKFGLEQVPDVPLPLEEITLAERLKGAGYVSGMVGKWHLDPNGLSRKWASTHLPQVQEDENSLEKENRIKIPAKYILQYSSLAQGFDECFQGEMRGYHATYDLDGRSLDPKGQEVKDPAFRLDVQTKAALAFIERQQKQGNRPFFLYLCYFGPHVPLEATPEYLARFPGKMAERRRHALAMISTIDDGVGQIRAALQRYGISDNTLIFYTSDNGAPLGANKEKSMADVMPVGKIGPFWDGSMNTPMTGEKGMLTEGGVRVPFLMSWPGKLPAGKVYDHPVITLDIASTAVAMAGLPRDKLLDGVNLVPYLTGEVSTPPHEALYWRFWNQAAVRSNKWKYIHVGKAGDYLFDLSSDASEKNNVIGQHPEIARTLAAKLSGWTKELLPPGMPSGPLNAQEEKWYQYYLGLDRE